jgi:hypothetical protein
MVRGLELLLIEKWSDGFVSAVELVGLGSNQKSA